MAGRIYPEPLQSGIELAAQALVFVGLTAEGIIDPTSEIRKYISQSNRIVPALLRALAKSVDIPADEVEDAVKKRSLELITKRMAN